MLLLSQTHPLKPLTDILIWMKRQNRSIQYIQSSNFGINMQHLYLYLNIKMIRFSLRKFLCRLWPSESFSSVQVFFMNISITYLFVNFAILLRLTLVRHTCSMGLNCQFLFTNNHLYRLNQLLMQIFNISTDQFFLPNWVTSLAFF